MDEELRDALRHTARGKFSNEITVDNEVEHLMSLIKADREAYATSRVVEVLDRIEQSKPDYSEMDDYNRSFLEAMYTNTVDKAIESERNRIAALKASQEEKKQ